MKRVGIISDTHSYWDDRYLKYFEECDEIWHAGDICSIELIVAQKIYANPPKLFISGHGLFVKPI